MPVQALQCTGISMYTTVQAPVQETHTHGSSPTLGVFTMPAQGLQ